ncbi:uncharacterized protein LOC124159361 [Ischnura elegans]|uniref:uncharacterized protein LOC124159361 n=1 Tax=Ischnura elegans TaxID=197161 RepID=UPI001ED8B7AF|nr:uncharacterized protein LOC124159361 [Ischnura elegans]
MESPPSGSTWLEAFPASDDSGLLLTSGSISSSSGEGCHCTLAMELQDSDDDGKSLSREGSLDYSDGMSCENFNTLKKGPGWPEFYSFENSCDGKLVPIDPPPEFQDSPPLSEVYQTVPAKNILVGPCRPLSAKSISRVSPASERRYIDKFSGKLVASILAEALSISCKVTWSIHCSQDCHPLECELGKFSQQSASSPRLCWTPELPLVPRTCPGSRASPASPLSRGRPSPPPHQPRRSDSTPGEIGDVYNVPFDSDVYAVPVDVVRPTADATTTTTSSRKASSSTQQTLQQPQRPGRRHLRKRRRHPSAAGSRSEATTGTTRGRGSTATLGQPQQQQSVATGTDSGGKRHSVPQSTTSPDPPAPANGASSGLAGRCCPTAGSSRTSARTKGGHRGASNEGRSSEPIHMTLQEVRQYLRNLYSGGGCGRVRGRGGENEGEAEEGGGGGKGGRHKGGGTAAAPQSATIVSNGKAAMLGAEGSSRETSGRSSSSSRHGGFSTNLRQTLCSIFRLRRVPASPGGGRRHATTARRPIPTPPESAVSSSALEDQVEQPSSEVPPPPFTGRALPPLPPSTRPPAPLPDETSPLSPPPMEEGDKGEDGAAGDQSVTEEPSMDFASSIEKVKDYGWYWGPISGEAAEKILFNEPDGSFIVRDSSDDHYIFSLTFKLNGCVRHVRIEHDQGNFSFGCCTKFKSHTIVDFIENAVEHSRSGRYLFFLHRRPVLGPMRVQLLHPVSRFKQVQSLQHMCRFVILKVVRRDLIQTLPLPRRIIDYLSTPHYYSEQTLEEERSGSSGAGSPGGGTRGGGGSLQQTPPPPPLSRPPEILPEDDTPPS